MMRKLFFKAVYILTLFFFLTPGLLQAKVSGNNPEEFLPVVPPEVSLLPQDKDLGIGPVKSVELGPLNSKMITEGKTIYANQCIICHDIDQNKLGPALKNVTKTRTPEYIMNLLLNPAQMQKDNATIKALLKQYNNLPMPDPALNQAKARSVLEYLRSLAK